MRKIHLVAVVAGLVSAACLVPAVAAASTSSSYTASGIELAATSTQGTFAGRATGSGGDTALWKAVVVHQDLSTGCLATSSGCPIDQGGSFSLVNNQLSSVTGSFTGGAVKLASQAPGCGIQVFDVDGQISTTQGTGTFDVVLTHFRTSLFGSCVTVFATVSGGVSFGP